ncbi:MAG: aminotransferase class V-fold PLP-dependent enzyme [Rhodospirillales bacterium]|nr:aminotransferase class V-fold PLP-dependent enzyme [Rhodospirillales bacterium]
MKAKAMALNMNQIVNDTPGKKKVIHFNNAGASLMPSCVLDAQVKYLDLEANIGGYEAAEQYCDHIEETYVSISRLLNCNHDEIAIVENASVGWSMVFHAIDFQDGDRILCAEAEYGSNYLAFLQLCREKNLTIDIIPSTPTGEVDLIKFEEMIDNRVKLVSVTHVPSNSGHVNPINEIGDITQRHNILYLVDACQSVGQMPIDVTEIKCDMLSATSRKYLRGPRGIGLLYVKSSILEELHPPIIDLRSAQLINQNEYRLQPNARRFENWENNYAAMMGFKSAIDYALEIGLDNIQTRINKLADNLRDKLEQIKEATLYCVGNNQCGIISFQVSGLDSEYVVQQMRAKGINLSVSYPVSTPIDAQTHRLPNLTRASLHYFNNTNEINFFISSLHSLIKSPS